MGNTKTKLNEENRKAVMWFYSGYLLKTGWSMFPKFTLFKSKRVYWDEIALPSISMSDKTVDFHFISYLTFQKKVIISSHFIFPSCFYNTSYLLELNGYNQLTSKDYISSDITGLYKLAFFEKESCSIHEIYGEFMRSTRAKTGS